MEISKINSLIRFYFNQNPDELDDDEFARAWGQLKFALAFDMQRGVANNQNQLRQMLGF